MVLQQFKRISQSCRMRPIPKSRSVGPIAACRHLDIAEWLGTSVCAASPCAHFGSTLKTLQSLDLNAPTYDRAALPLATYHLLISLRSSPIAKMVSWRDVYVILRTGCLDRSGHGLAQPDMRGRPNTNGEPCISHNGWIYGKSRENRSTTIWNTGWDASVRTVFGRPFSAREPAGACGGFPRVLVGRPLVALPLAREVLPGCQGLCEVLARGNRAQPSRC